MLKLGIYTYLERLFNPNTFIFWWQLFHKYVHRLLFYHALYILHFVFIYFYNYYNEYVVQ